LLRVPVSFGTGKPIPMVVDTGSAATLIFNRREVESRGWRMSGKVSLSGAGSKRCEGQVTEALKAVVGSTSLPPTEAYVVSFALIERFLHDRIDGVIGGGFFEGRVLRLDYNNHTVVNVAETTNADGKYAAVPLRRAGGHCCHVQATIVLGKTALSGDFLVDSGAPAAELLLSPRFASRNHIKTGEGEQVEFPGLCAMSRFSRFTTPVSLRLGDMTLDEVKTLVSHDRNGAFASGGFDGVIGGKLLRRFSEVIIDMPRSRILLKK